EFIRWDGEFKNCYSMALIRCSTDNYEWSSRAHNLVNIGSGCPHCAGNRRWTADERIDQINSLENIEFVSWVDWYKGSRSKANVRCEVDGFEWSAEVSSLVSSGHGCPHCSGSRIWTSDERIEQINKLDSIKFVCWVDSYENSHSKANLRCLIDGYEWSASVSSIVHAGSGCPKCAGNRRWTGEERIEQINSIENIEFVSWVDGYRGCESKANVRCKLDGFEWSASVNSIVNNRTGCPKCAKYGYDQSETGALYALRSECGMHVKVGISNKPSQRHRKLERSTPFSFSCIEQISGEGDKIRELEKYFHSKYERAGLAGFDGCTEWLICTPELLEELRNLGDK
ncbi:MAG: zinc-ribbon domain-containing protein, partial [Aeromonas veronii]